MRRPASCAAVLLLIVILSAVARADVSPDVVHALLKLEQGAATEADGMRLFAANKELNRMRFKGWITDNQFQLAQREYTARCSNYGRQAADDVGAKFWVQERTSKPIQPGTDTDLILEVKNSKDPVGDIRNVQSKFNELVNADMQQHLGKSFVPRNDWHEHLDVDFMADPRYVTDAQFREIAKLNNMAYSKRGAAEMERRLRDKTAGPATRELVHEFAEQMKEFEDTKRTMIKEMSKPRGNSLPSSAEITDITINMTLEQKYIERLELAARKM